MIIGILAVTTVASLVVSKRRGETISVGGSDDDDRDPR